MLTLRVIVEFVLSGFRLCLRQLVLTFYSPTSLFNHLHKSRRTQPPSNQHRHATTKPEWLKTEIIRLKACMPQAGCRTIAILCNRRYAAARKVSVGKTYVSQVLRQHRYEIDILRRKLKHAQPRPLPRNLIWGIDLTGKTDAQACPEPGRRGSLHQILGIIDHGSRAVLCLQALHAPKEVLLGDNKTSRTLLACLLQAIHTHGKPKMIRTDNEAIFTSRVFRLGLKTLGIRHQRTDPGCPWQNGRIERFFGTLKQQLDQWQVPDSSQLNHDLNTFLYWYNHVRPHQHLNGKTPAEAWIGIDPYTQAPKAEYEFHAWEGLLTGYCLRR